MIDSLRKDESPILKNLVKTNMIEKVTFNKIGELDAGEEEKYPNVALMTELEQELRETLGMSSMLGKDLYKRVDLEKPLNILGRFDTRFL